MPLERGEYLGTGTSRQVCRFTMYLQDREIHFAVSFEAMDDLAKKLGTERQQRDAMFEELRSTIEEMAERKFFSFNDETLPQGELLLRSKDFFP